MKKTILFLTTIALLCSCGSRKTQRSKIVEETKIEVTDTGSTKINTDTKVTENVKEVTKVETDKNTNVVTETKTIKPIDATKPSKYKGDEFQNAEINESKTVDLSTEKTVSLSDYNKAYNLAKKATLLAKRLYKEKLDLQRQLENSKTDRKQSYWFLLWLLLLIPIWWILRKYRII